MEIAIIIPARFNSSRFPGKVLHKICDVSMIERVIYIALTAAKSYKNVRVIVAIDDERVRTQIKHIEGIEIYMTSIAETGSDRIYQLLEKYKNKIDYVINYQGDAPLTHPEILSQIINKIIEKKDKIEVITPYIKLTWQELDKIKIKKNISSSASGTFIIKSNDDNAFWFSKNIIPNIRKEDRDRKYSPILRHIGIYGYRNDLLEKFVKLPISYYEKIEELEQLRFLENGYQIKLLDLTHIGYPVDSGVDTLEDIQRAEEFIRKYGEFFDIKNLYV